MVSRSVPHLLLLGVSLSALAEQRPMDPLLQWEKDFAFDTAKADEKINGTLGEGDRRLCFVDLVTPTPEYYKNHLLPTTRRALVKMYNLKTLVGVTAVVNFNDHNVEEFNKQEWDNIGGCFADGPDADRILSTSELLRREFGNIKLFEPQLWVYYNEEQGNPCYHSRCLFGYLRNRRTNEATQEIVVDLKAERVWFK